MNNAATKTETCQVRSGTEHPCQRPAVVKIRGVPFCEPCAREQEAYFAIGKLTETPSRSGYTEALSRILGGIRQTAHHDRVRTSERSAA